MSPGAKETTVTLAVLLRELQKDRAALDGQVPSGDRSHRELLEQMATELPTVRGAVLEARDEADLAELLKFRHFFRHAYAVPLDPAKVLVEAKRVERLAASVGASLTTFEQFLTETLALATRPP